MAFLSLPLWHFLFFSVVLSVESLRNLSFSAALHLSGRNFVVFHIRSNYDIGADK